MLKEISYQLADTKELLLQSYRLVYDRYQKKGFCKKNIHQMYFNFHDLHPDTRTFIAMHHNKVIATLSVVPDGTLGLPSDHLFSHHLNYLRQTNHNIAEVSRFAVAQQYQAIAPFIFHYLFQLVYHSYISTSHFSDCVILIEPRNRNLYKKLGFVECSGIAFDDEANNTPSQLMLLKLKEDGKIVENNLLSGATQKLTGFHYFLNKILKAQRDLTAFAKKITQNNKYFNQAEYQMINFKNLLLKSYQFQHYKNSNHAVRYSIQFESIQALYHWVNQKPIHRDVFTHASTNLLSEVS